MVAEQVAIYALVDPRDGSVRYVGQTTAALEVRLSQHVNERGAGSKSKWIRDLATCGLRPAIGLLEVVPVADAGMALA